MDQSMLPKPFIDVADADESFFWTGEPLFVPFLLSGVPFLILGLCWGAFDYFGFIRGMKPEMYATMIPFSCCTFSLSTEGY
jgi:hypothetical protein